MFSIFHFQHPSGEKMKSTAHMLGVQHRSLGFSIFYNPFRHKGSPQEYLDWILGWKQEGI